MYEIADRWVCKLWATVKESRDFLSNIYLSRRAASRYLTCVEMIIRHWGVYSIFVYFA